ncbi:RNA polymerase sigma factor [Clostridium tetani]|uniref:RNA polymerase sigma factor n=1 Tax=Clostridium tetani TaxID=1513 RepID=UPI0037BF9728
MTLQDFSPSEQHILKEELITHVKSAINQLNWKYQQVIILRYYNNLTFNEIAASLKVKSNTVRVWHMRAKAYIYDWLNTNYYK